MEWTTELTYAAAGLTDNDTTALAHALTGADISYTAGRLHVQIAVDADTLEEATASALRTAGAATGLLKPTGLQIMPTTEFRARAFQPVELDLIGVTEIAAELGVTRQRASKIAASPDFPTHVANPAAGKVYTRESVKEFQRRWQPHRNPKGGRPRRRLTTDTTPKGDTE